MKVKFCGAAQEVTGSCHLITLDDGYKVLLDCGLYQGYDDDMENFNGNWYFDPKEIDCVILSHAHIDHSGRLPLLCKHGYDGPIYCTHATRSLCAIMLLDSAKIQERDAAYQNKHIKGKKKKVKPLYETADVQKAMSQFVSIAYNKYYRADERVSFVFKDAGHILGSASVGLQLRENGKTIRVGFTGDIGRPDRAIIRDPQPMDNADYVICESTYGSSIHDGKPLEHEKFLEVIRHTCVEKRGKVIIPAFSVGRTQEIVYIFDRLHNEGKLPKIPIYLDSPLAINATTVYLSHPECYDQDLTEYLMKDDNPFGFNTLQFIRSVDNSKRLNTSKEPCVIISASGMMNAGRVKHHLFNNMEDPKNTFLMVGYCSPYTPGGQLLAGRKELRLFGETKQVNAEVVRLKSLSAHGDQNEMFNFLKNQLSSCKRMFLVHGELDTQQVWQKYLEDKGFKNIEIPTLKQTFELE